MDITHQREGEDEVRQSKHTHKHGEFENSGNHTDKKCNQEADVCQPFGNVRIHSYHFRVTGHMNVKVQELFGFLIP